MRVGMSRNCLILCSRLTVIATVLFFPATIGFAAVLPSITLATSANPAVYGKPLSLTASVSPGTATGKVTFYDGVAILGIGTLTAGQATLTTTLLPAGARSLKAYYSGDANNRPSTSMPFTQTITPVPGIGFAAPLSYQASPAAFGVVGDFNGDGKPDLATANFPSGPITIFLGNGDGTFQAPQATSTSFAVADMAVGDFNGDGKADLVLTGPFRPGTNVSVTVLLGNGDGTFQPAVVYPGSGMQTSSIGVSDFNGDGIPDIAVGFVGQVGIYLGNGDGTFQNVALFAANPSNFVNFIAIGDFNGDGIADVIATNAFSGTVLLGQGDGTFATVIPVGVNAAFPIAVGDFNGDGVSDLATSDGDVFLGNGDGTFFREPSLFPASSGGGSGIVLPDVNGDGVIDAVLLIADNAVVFLGNGDGTFKPSQSYNADPDAPRQSPESTSS